MPFKFSIASIRRVTRLANTPAVASLHRQTIPRKRRIIAPNPAPESPANSPDVPLPAPNPAPESPANSTGISLLLHTAIIIFLVYQFYQEPSREDFEEAKEAMRRGERPKPIPGITYEQLLEAKEAMSNMGQNEVMVGVPLWWYVFAGS